MKKGTWHGFPRESGGREGKEKRNLELVPEEEP